MNYLAVLLVSKLEKKMKIILQKMIVACSVLLLVACASHDNTYLNPLVDSTIKLDPERYTQKQLIMYQRIKKDGKVSYKQVKFGLYDPDKQPVN